MHMSCRTGVIAVVFTLGVAAGAVAEQAGHQAHDTKPQASHKMTMPAMDDAHFVEIMMKHHQDGIEMAKLEESRGTRQDVKALATKIREEQEKDLQELQGHQGKHGEMKGHEGHAAAAPQGTTGAKPAADMQKHNEMMASMAQQSKQKIESASGEGVDHAFAHEMAMHHEMALEMITKTKFKDPELRKLAQRMAAGQKNELAQLKAMQKK